MNVIGHEVVAGIPFINGRPAKLDPPKDPIELLDGAFSKWRCPECGARLSGEETICLNLCHLSAASARRFADMMADVMYRVNRREWVKAQMKAESGFLGEFLGEIADPEDFESRSR